MVINKLPMLHHILHASQLHHDVVEIYDVSIYVLITANLLKRLRSKVVILSQFLVRRPANAI